MSHDQIVTALWIFVPTFAVLIAMPFALSRSERRAKTKRKAIDFPEAHEKACEGRWRH